jgi:hypothetical protein
MPIIRRGSQNKAAWVRVILRVLLYYVSVQQSIFYGSLAYIPLDGSLDGMIRPSNGTSPA